MSDLLKGGPGNVRTTRDSLDRTAARYREEAARSGNSITHEQAQRRVAAALTRRDNRGK